MKIYQVEKNYNPNNNDKYAVNKMKLGMITIIHLRARDGFRSLIPHLIKRCRLTKSGANKLKSKMELKCQ